MAGRWRVQAVHLTMRVPHVFSHDSAALLHDLPLVRPRLAAVHVTRPGVTGSRSRYGVRHHGAAYGPDQVVEVSGLPVLDRARTVVDLSRTHGYRSGLVAADAALRRGVSRAALAATLARMPGWPGAGSAREVLADADPGAESAGESLARDLVSELGLGRPQTQFPVLTDRGIAWCDLRLGCHVVEFDGRVKYRHTADGGPAHDGAEAAVWAERERQRAVCSRGLGMSRLVWADFWGDARVRAISRLRAEYEVTLARFGSRLSPELAEFARRVRPRRVPE